MSRADSAARIRPAAGPRGGALGVLLALCAAGAAQAEVARVRSGDHGSFTRLVIELAAPADWRFGRTGDGYALAFGRQDVQLDLDGVFGTIPRTRVATVAQDEASGALQIGIGCDPCHATALDYLGTWIVIDVAEGPPPPGSPFEEALEAESAEPSEAAAGPATATDAGEGARAIASGLRPPPRRPVSAAAAEGEPDAGAPARPDERLPAELPGALVGAVEEPEGRPQASLGSAWTGASRAETLRPPGDGALPLPEGAAPPPEPETASQAADRPASAAPSTALVDTRPWLSPGGALPPGFAALAPGLEPDTAASGPNEADAPVAAQRRGLTEYRDRLLEELSRAASQGLLEADLPSLDRARTPPVLASEPAEPEDRPLPAAPPDPQAEDHLRITAETSIDRDTRAPRPGGGATPGGLVCIDDAALDLASWGRDGTPSEGISELRGALVGEFDRPDPDAVLGLARYYLFLGFGAEARATVTGFGVESRDADTVMALAALLDGETSELTESLVGQAACPGRAALWGTVANAANPEAEPPNARAVLAAFGELPLHLRRQLGPDLAARFLAIGDSDTAIALRDSTTRALEDGASDFALFDAELGRAEGNQTDAGDLIALAGSGDAHGARAFAAYLEGELTAGRVPEAGSLTAEALAFEAGPTDEGRRLAELALESRLVEGDFDGARREILRRAEEAPDEEAGAAADRWAKFAEAITAGAPDAEFLRQAFAARDDLDRLLPQGPAATALAVRLTGLGFADEALRYLPPSPPGEPAGEAARLARAEALLQTGSAAAAFGELAGMSGTAADRLSARALLALGDARAASDRFAAAGDVQMADLAAQRAEAWDRLSDDADPRFLRVAELRASPAVSVPAAGAETATATATASADAADDAGERATADPTVEDQPPGRLAAARAALESGRTARDLAQALLAAPPAETAPAPDAPSP
ncbi:MAG: hypothetical protein MUE98_03450 [Rhodobacteraceae bacterium]|nr:hypothetical protein [Paracoccaceae bacterium]